MPVLFAIAGWSLVEDLLFSLRSLRMWRGPFFFLAKRMQKAQDSFRQRSTIMKRKLVLIHLFLTAAVCYGAGEQTPEQFLRNLYLHDHKPMSKPMIDFGKRESLSKYFDAALTALFIKDAECQERTHEICNLDFDPIYDAQDVDDKTTGLKISTVKQDPAQFAVTFTNIGTRTLIYTVKKSKEGWRISDIRYSKGESLKAILSGKPG
jgi:hypothetical protein